MKNSTNSTVSKNSILGLIKYKWIKVFRNGPSKICGRQLLKNFVWSIFEYLDANMAEKSMSKIISLITC